MHTYQVYCSSYCILVYDEYYMHARQHKWQSKHHCSVIDTVHVLSSTALISHISVLLAAPTLWSSIDGANSYKGRSMVSHVQI